MTVVVADDDPDIRHLVRYKLEQAGSLVHATGDGVSALAACREHRPDLVLLDVTMPRMNGLDVCRRLRSSGDLRDVAIIMCTAMTSDTDVAEGYAAGADDYIAKPFGPRDLTDRIDAVWGHRTTV